MGIPFVCALMCTGKWERIKMLHRVDRSEQEKIVYLLV